MESTKESPRLHIQWTPPPDFRDPTGEISSAVLNQLEQEWERALAEERKPFFTGIPGQVTIRPIFPESWRLDPAVVLCEVIQEARGIVSELENGTTILGMEERLKALQVMRDCAVELARLDKSDDHA